MSQKQRDKLKFTYDVYKDLIINGNNEGYKNLLNISMRQRIDQELKNKKNNFFDKYYQNLLISQYKDVKSLPLYFKNQLRGLFNI